jgi:hypothetical protein
MVADGDGDLWIAGDAGAVFMRKRGDWREQNLHTPGQVTALGVDRDGTVIAGQSGGQIYRARGTGWDLLGQVGSTPAALGALPDGRVVVVGADGSLRYESDDTNDFMEPGEYRAPPGSHAVHDATISGVVVAIATADRAWVWDGALWDSGDPSVRTPAGLPGAGELFAAKDGGPIVLSIPPADLEPARYFVPNGEHLEERDTIDYAGATVPAALFTSTLSSAGRSQHTWLEDRLYTVDGSGLHRFDGANGLTLVAPLGGEPDEILTVSGLEASGGAEIWAGGRSGAVHHVRLAEPSFTIAIAHERFQALYGDEFYPYSLEVLALAPGVALVRHDQSRLTRVGTDGSATPVEIPFATTALARVAGVCIGLSREGVYEVDPNGTVHGWTLPRGAEPAPERRSVPKLATAGDAALLVVELPHGDTGLVRCRSRRCEPVDLPRDVRPAGVATTHEGRVLVLETDGVLGALSVR